MSHFWRIAKVATAAAIIWLLVHTKVLDLAALLRLRGHIKLVLVVMGAVFLSYVMASIRWWLLFRIQEFKYSFLHIFNLNYLSTFSLIFLPGGGAGDLFRVAIASKLAPQDRARSVLTVLADRVLALTSLSSWAAVAVLLNWRSLFGPMHYLALLILVFPACSIGAGLVLVLMAPRFGRLSFGNGKIRRSIRAKIFAILMSGATFLLMVRRHPVQLALAFGCALLTTGLVLLAFLAVSQIFNLPYLSKSDYLLAAPIAMVVNAIPLTPGGIGVGEAAFGQICTWLADGNLAPYATIYLTYRILAAVVASYGLIPFFNLRHLLATTAPANELEN